MRVERDINTLASRRKRIACLVSLLLLEVVTQSPPLSHSVVSGIKA